MKTKLTKPKSYKNIDLRQFRGAKVKDIITELSDRKYHQSRVSKINKRINKSEIRNKAKTLAEAPVTKPTKPHRQKNNDTRDIFADTIDQTTETNSNRIQAQQKHLRDYVLNPEELENIQKLEFLNKHGLLNDHLNNEEAEEENKKNQNLPKEDFLHQAFSKIEDEELVREILNQGKGSEEKTMPKDLQTIYSPEQLNKKQGLIKPGTKAQFIETTDENGNKLVRVKSFSLETKQKPELKSSKIDERLSKKDNISINIIKKEQKTNTAVACNTSKEDQLKILLYEYQQNGKTLDRKALKRAMKIFDFLEKFKLNNQIPNYKDLNRARVNMKLLNFAENRNLIKIYNYCKAQGELAGIVKLEELADFTDFIEAFNCCFNQE